MIRKGMVNTKGKDRGGNREDRGGEKEGKAASEERGILGEGMVMTKGKDRGGNRKDRELEELAYKTRKRNENRIDN